MSQPPQTTAPSQPNPKEWVVGDVAEIRYQIFDFKGIWKVHFTGENINMTIQDLSDKIACGILDREAATVEYVFRHDEGFFAEYVPLRTMKRRTFGVVFKRRPFLGGLVGTV